jgi:hypothetical protein
MDASAGLDAVLRLVAHGKANPRRDGSEIEDEECSRPGQCVCLFDIGDLTRGRTGVALLAAREGKCGVFSALWKGRK